MERVPRPMVADLAAQECVDGGHGVGVFSGDPHPCAPLGLFIEIADRLLLFDQDGTPGMTGLHSKAGSYMMAII